MKSQVHVVGGGVIGLACAWWLARDGHDVVLVGPSPGRSGASWVAAGMLAPVTEAQFGESALTSVLVEAARRWPGFARELEDATGADIGHDASGTLAVALDASDRASLDDLLSYQLSLGLEARRLGPSDCRRLLPALNPAVRGGIEVPGDHQVDNRKLLAALVTACTEGGVAFVEGTVAALEVGPVLLLEDGRRIGAQSVLLAAGVGTTAIAGMHEAGLPALRPVKGHILRLGPADPSSAGTRPLLSRTVRGLVRGRTVYLVPRHDGSIVVGATVEERGHDAAVRAGAVHDLLCDARSLVPGVDELELLEAATGFRPATPDNTPRIGWTRLDGVAAAVGHYRNGVLLAPLTAAAATDLMARRSPPPLVQSLALR